METGDWNVEGGYKAVEFILSGKEAIVFKVELEYLSHNMFTQFPLGCVRREIIGYFGYSIVSHVHDISKTLSQAPLHRASFIPVSDLIWNTYQNSARTR